jgi:HEAT repeat protein
LFYVFGTAAAPTVVPSQPISGQPDKSTTAVVTGSEAKLPGSPLTPPVIVDSNEATLPTPATPTNNPTLLNFVDKSAKNRLPVDFPAKIPALYTDEDIAWVLYVLRDSSDLDAIRNEAANLLRRSKVKNLEDHFYAILKNPAEKERFTSYAIQHLGDMMTEYRDGTANDSMARAATIRKQLSAALTDPRLMVRSEALLALTRERDPTAVAIIRKGLTEPAGDQGQDLLIRCAKEANLTDLIPAIRPLAYSENQVVRIAAVNVLAQWKDEASRPAFEEASRSTIQRIQRAGDLALRLLDPATN